jgi:hypothetical protein
MRLRTIWAQKVSNLCSHLLVKVSWTLQPTWDSETKTSACRATNITQVSLKEMKEAAIMQAIH